MYNYTVDLLKQLGWTQPRGVPVPAVQPALQVGRQVQSANPPNRNSHNAVCEFCRWDIYPGRHTVEDSTCAGCGRMGCDVHVKMFSMYESMSSNQDRRNQSPVYLIEDQATYPSGRLCTDCHIRLTTGIIKLLYDNSLLPAVQRESDCCQSPGCPVPYTSHCQSCNGQFCGYHLSWWEHSDQITCINCVLYYEYEETQYRWLHQHGVNACSECGSTSDTQMCVFCHLPTCVQCGLYIKENHAYAHDKCYHHD